MNEENDVDDLNQEQIIRNHLPKQAYATQNVQEEPDNVLPSKGKTKSRHTIIIGVSVSIVVLTSLLLFIVLGFGMGILNAHREPIVVYQANTKAAQKAVTWQQDNGKPVVVPDKYLQVSHIIKDVDAGIRNVLSTPQNATAEITLGDGTEVTLNADSKLFFPLRFEDETREVQLQGEAYFKVSRDVRHPFVVKTNGITTKVFDAEFNIRAYHKNNMHVTLLQGFVEVCAGSVTKCLRPGEDAALAAEKFEVNRVETEGFVAWTLGEFYFDNATLADIGKDIGRWYNVSVVFQDPSKMHTRVGFTAFRDANIEEIVEMLNRLNKAKFTYQDGQITID